MRALWRIAPRVVRAVPLVCAVMAAVQITLLAAAIPENAEMPMAWARIAGAPTDREPIARQLAAEGGQHLVIVHHGAGHNGFAEYVYNAADIDRSPIVWARDMGAGKNAELVRYFSTRKVWRLEVTQETSLLPYDRR